MVISIEAISKALPHRFPFLLIDRVIDLIPEKSIVALKNVTCNEQFFQGHFPEWKIMPGVLIIEAIAQAGAIRFAVAIPVRIVQGHGRYMEVESDRLQAGMMLVTRGTYQMVPGTPVWVRPKEQGGPAQPTAAPAAPTAVPAAPTEGDDAPGTSK